MLVIHMITHAIALGYNHNRIAFIFHVGHMLLGPKREQGIVKPRSDKHVVEID
jgi:hypothetical protein